MTDSSQLTYVGVLLAVLAEQLYLPIPSPIFLMAAGALVAQGEMSASILVLVAVFACLAADALWFWFGRRWGSKAIRVLSRFTAGAQMSSNHAHQTFRRYGLAILCVAKFLPGVNAVLPPLIAAEGVSITGFFGFDVVGSLLWSGFYTGLGYLFSNEMDVAFRWAKHLGTALGLVIIVPISLYACWRGLTLLRMVRRLRLRRISPPFLARKLKSKGKVAVLDLLDFENEKGSESPEGIPGAFRVDPSRLRNAPHITVPTDVDIVLYSSSGSDLVSARAAMGLRRIGVEKVWVLDGGLKAWREQGFPVSQCLESPEVAAERVGVKLPPRGWLETGASR